MSNVLIINPPVRIWSKPNCLPLGLAIIASVLEKHGHDVEVLDLNVLRTQQLVLHEKGGFIYDIPWSKYDPDIICIGGIITTYKFIKGLIPELRGRYPRAKIIVGGPVASTIPHIMAKNDVDAVCIGEGEEAILNLIKAQPEGKIYDARKLHNPVNLNELPLPAWHLFDMETYSRNPIGHVNRNKWVDGGGETELSMNLYASRSCPFRCNYCAKDFMGYKYRVRSSPNVVAEIFALVVAHDITYFHFIDDEFMLNKKFVDQFCKDMIKLNSGSDNTAITWGCTGRVNLVDEEIVKLMYEAGCRQIVFGIESGSRKMLDWMNKGVTVEQAETAVKLVQKYMGYADCSFMIGYPDENEETIQDTVDFCKKVNLAPEVVFFLTPYPGAPLYDWCLENGKIGDEEEYVLGLSENEQGEKIKVNLTKYSDDELYKIQKDMIAELKAQNAVKH